MITRGVLRQLGWAALTGLSAAFAFPLVIAAVSPEPLLDFAPRELFVFVATALLYARCRQGTLREAMLWAGVAGLFFFAVLLYWLDVAMARYGEMPQWQALPVLALLVAFCACFWALLPAVHRLVVARTPVPGPLAFAAAVVAVEWLRSTLFTGFPWGQLGYALARSGPVLALSRVGGVWLLTFAVALLGALLAHGREVRRGVLGWAPAVAAATGLWIVALLQLAAWQPAGEAWTRVGVVQGNVAQRVKNRDVEHAALIRSRYLELSRSVAASVDWLVWPEAAWPGHVSTETRRLFEQRLGVPLLAGASTLLPGSDRLAHNSAFWLGADGRVSARYDKRHLVPFGEYVPLRHLLPVEKVVPGSQDYLAGGSAEPIGEPAAGVLICYDGVFPELAREAVNQGAAVLVNLTNDAWYGVSSAPYQHLDFYVVRAVETDRWVIRAANTGVSVFIDPEGGLHGATRLGETTVSAASVQARNTTTLYVAWGDWLPALALGIVAAALLELGLARLLALAAARRLANARPQPLTAIAGAGTDAAGKESHGRSL
jgi:apolipoprotein N-acyltransferase